MTDIHSDPLADVRTAKRLATVGIFATVLLLLPVYGLVLGLSIGGVLVVVGPTALLSFLGIEFVSGWEYRMRRRYAYPYRLGYELAGIYEFPQACHRSAQLLGRWLRPSAVVVAWPADDGQSLSPAAAFGLPDGWMETAPSISLGARGLSTEAGRLLSKRSAQGDPWFGSMFPGDRIVYVPLVSTDRIEGVVAIAAPPRNALVGDQRLLLALGMVMGLALDNCRLYEGQRAHARHLEEVNRMKSDFLATISHELRTPLTSIMLAGEMLQEEERELEPDGNRERLARSIVKGATRLSSLVADLVAISRDDEFRPRLELDDVAVQEIMATSVAIVQPLLANKQQTLEVRLTESQSTVRVDRTRMEQVLINLLSNAHRYTPVNGRILVSGDEAGGEALISVTDSGPGVPVSERERIFEPFYRGDRSGLGLGLAIAKSLVELHGGRIWVESAKGEGSVFTVALPVREARPRTVASPAARSA